MPLIHFFVLASQVFSWASLAARAFAPSVSEALSFGFDSKGGCVVPCPPLEARFGTARSRRCSTCFAVARLWRVRSTARARATRGIIWPGLPVVTALEPGICEAAPAGFIALGFRMSDARAAGLIELGLAMSEGAALGFTPWAPPWWPEPNMRRTAKA